MKVKFFIKELECINCERALTKKLIKENINNFKINFLKKTLFIKLPNGMDINNIKNILKKYNYDNELVEE